MGKRWTIASLALLLAMLVAVPVIAGDFEDAQRALKVALADPSATSRDKVSAVEALGAFDRGRDCKKACEALFDVLDSDPDREVAGLMAEQQKLIADRARIWEPIQRSGMITQAQQQQLAQIDMKIDALEDKIRAASEIKDAAIRTLARMNSADGQEQLLEGVGERKWRIAVGSIEAARLQRWRGAFDAVALQFPGNGDKANKEDAVRLVAIRYMTEVEPVRGVKSILLALQDDNLLVRMEAIRGCKAARQPECIPALINRLGERDGSEYKDVEVGKIRWDVVDALRDLTGEDRNDDAEQWMIWWNANKNGFQVPAPGSGAGGPVVRNDAEGNRRTGIDFFGVPIETNRPIFVIDKSGSMLSAVDEEVAQKQIQEYMRQNPGAQSIPPIPPPAGSRSKWEAVQDELFATIQKLFEVHGEEAYFGIVYYSTDVTMFNNGAMMKASKKNVEAVERYIRQMEADGLTNIYDAFKAAFSMAQGGAQPGSVFTDGGTELRADTLIFLTDGAPTVGPSIDGVAPTNPPNQTYSPLLLRQINKWNETIRLTIHTVCCGQGDQRFLEQLASDNNGNYRLVNKDEK